MPDIQQFREGHGGPVETCFLVMTVGTGESHSRPRCQNWTKKGAFCSDSVQWQGVLLLVSEENSKSSQCIENRSPKWDCCSMYLGGWPQCVHLHQFWWDVRCGPETLATGGVLGRAQAFYEHFIWSEAEYNVVSLSQMPLPVLQASLWNHGGWSSQRPVWAQQSSQTTTGDWEERDHPKKNSDRPLPGRMRNLCFPAHSVSQHPAEDLSQWWVVWARNAHRCLVTLSRGLLACCYCDCFCAGRNKSSCQVSPSDLFGGKRLWCWLSINVHFISCIVCFLCLKIMIGELSLASVRITCCHDTTRFPEYLDDVWTFTCQEKDSPKINVQIDVYPPWN